MKPNASPPVPPPREHPNVDDPRVREHLANERTFLAWTRTGISMMGFGVVIAKLRYLFPANVLTPPVKGIIHASNVGLAFTIIGLLTVVLSAWRFRVVREEIRAQQYRASSSIVVAFTLVTLVLAAVVIWYLVEGSAARP